MTQTRILGTLLTGAVLLISMAWMGCKDEIADPTHGTVEIRLSSPTAGTYEGGSIWYGSTELEENVSLPIYEKVLPVGEHVLRFEKDCVAVSPAREIHLTVEPGQRSYVAWDVSAEGGLSVESSMAGASIFIDGNATDQTTPATLTCLEPGDHDISVSLFGAEAVAGKTVTIPADGSTVAVDFDLTPLPQARGALVEIVTATNCPNCGPVDAAAESLWTHPDFAAHNVVSIQIHTRWSIPDVFHTPSTLARNLFYGDQERQGLPWRITNGITSARGAGRGNIPELIAAMRGEVMPFLDGTNPPSPVAMYWMDPELIAGDKIRGTVRVVALESLPVDRDYSVIACDYKQSLVTFVAIHNQNETFFRVVRDIDTHETSLQDMGVLNRGDWVDLPYEFDISYDTEWTEEGMGLVAFVQDLDSKVVYQVVHAGF